LQFASEELRSDLEVVVAAAQDDSNAYSFMCKDSPEFIHSVIAQDWRAVRSLEPSLLLNSDIVRTAVASNGLALSVLPSEVLLEDGLWDEIAPHVCDLYIFRVRLLSGQSCLSVWRDEYTRAWDVLKDCAAKMKRARLADGRIFLGTEELWGSVWYWPVEKGQLYDLQLVL